MINAPRTEDQALWAITTPAKRRILLLLGFVCAVAAVFAVGVRGDAAGEIGRLAELMPFGAQGKGWAGGVVADIGAGDGAYAFAAAGLVGTAGRVYATEIDEKKVAALKSEVARRKMGNVIVMESKEAETNLPAGCCDAIYLRRVYHHLTKPAEFDAGLVRSLKSGGRLAIIDFAPRAGLDPVEGVPSNRGGHGIPEKIVIEELKAAGLTVEKIVEDWPEGSYCVVFGKK